MCTNLESSWGLPVPEVAVNESATAEYIDGIPLFLIPKIISEQIRKKHESVFMIRVERKFMHQYTVIVETHDEFDMRVNTGGPSVQNDQHDKLV